MRILFLTQVLPYPLDAGPKIRAYYVLRYLAQAGHEITLLSFMRDSDPSQAIEHLRKFCQNVITVPMRRSRLRDGWYLLYSLLRNRPFLIARDHMPPMAQAVRSLVQAEAFDAVHADQLWMAPYALLARQQSNFSSPLYTVLDQHNAVFQIPRRLARSARPRLLRMLFRQEAHRLARYEAHTIQQFDRVVWVTREDRQALVQWYAAQPGRPILPPERSLVIPICVDPDTYSLVSRHPAARRITFLGGMHWPPNAEGIRWFVQEVWPHVHHKVPEALLTIIGKSPPAGLASQPAVEVTGYVADVTPYLSDTAVFIAPLRAGGGMRVKILEAWARGLPVVSTTIGAEGLQARHEENLLLADNALDFAQAVVRLFQDQSLADRLGSHGYNTVQTSYCWRTVYCAWNEIYA